MTSHANKACWKTALQTELYEQDTRHMFWRYITTAKSTNVLVTMWLDGVQVIHVRILDVVLILGKIQLFAEILM